MGDLSCIQIFFEIRIHILVKTSRRNGVTGRLCLQKHLYEPEGLAGFIKALCRFCRYTLAVGCDHKKLLLSHRILAGSCLFSGQDRITAGIVDRCFTADDHCFQESGTFCIICFACGMSGQFLFCFSHDPFITKLQHFPVFYGKVTDSIIEIVAGCENVMLHGKKRFLCHKGSRQITGRLSFPVFVSLMKLLFCLLGNVERVR